MNCVYHAYEHALFHEIGLVPTTVDWHLYRLLKRVSHGSLATYTYGGCVPFIVQALAWLHEIRVTVEHRVWTPAHYAYSADSAIQRWMVRRGDFGDLVDECKLSPAIYLPAAEIAHAVFCEWTIVPGAMMALQLKGGNR